MKNHSSEIMFDLESMSKGQLDNQDFLDKYDEFFPLIMIELDDKIGPVIRYSEDLPWIEQSKNNDILIRFSLDSVILGMRESYNNTIAYLPSPKTSKWRSLVISITGIKDKKFHEGFFQVVLFIPREFYYIFDSVMRYEKKLIEIVSKIVTDNNLAYDRISKEIKSKFLEFAISMT